MSSTVSAGAAAAAASSASSSSSSSSASHTGPRGAATEDDEDAVDDKEYTQPPTNDDDDDVEDVATLIELYVTSTAAFQEGWDSLTGPQQQQIIRASRSILVSNEEDEFYDAQEYGQDEERTVLMNDDHDAHHDHHANNNDAAAVVIATAGLANEDDAGPVPPAPASPPIDDNNADDDLPPPPPPNDDAPTPVLPSDAVVDNFDNAVAVAAEQEQEDRTTRNLLTFDGFDPDYLNKTTQVSVSTRDGNGYTPMTYYCRRGNVTMVRYLIAHDADCRITDTDGYFPLYVAAYYGHLEIIKLLSQVGGAHEDIVKQNWDGDTPLRIALREDHFDVVHWLLLNGALWSPHDGDWFRWWQGQIDGGIVQERERGWIEDGVDNGVINDAAMRNDLSPTYSTSRRQYGPDKRETVLAWVRDAVATYDNVVTLLLTGTIASASTSPLVVFKGTSEILELIAQYVAGTPQQVRMLRQLMVLLSAFIDDTQFVDREEEEEEEDEDEDEDEDEEDY